MSTSREFGHPAPLPVQSGEAIHAPGQGVGIVNSPEAGVFALVEAGEGSAEQIRESIGVVTQMIDTLPAGDVSWAASPDEAQYWTKNVLEGTSSLITGGEELGRCTPAIASVVRIVDGQNGEKIATWSAVGDIRIYHVSGDTVQQITTDEGDNHQELTNWLGDQSQGVKYTDRISCKPGDRLIIANNAVTGDAGDGGLTLEQIKQIVDGRNSGEAAQSLLDASVYDEDRAVLVIDLQVKKPGLEPSVLAKLTKQERLAKIAFGDLSTESGHIGAQIEGQREPISKDIVLPNDDILQVLTEPSTGMPMFAEKRWPLYTETATLIKEYPELNYIREFVGQNKTRELVQTATTLAQKVMDIYLSASMYPAQKKRVRAAEKLGISREQYAAEMYREVVQHIYDVVMDVPDIPLVRDGHVVTDQNGSPKMTKDKRWSKQLNIAHVKMLREVLADRAEKDGKMRFLTQNIETGGVMTVGRGEMYPDIIAAYFELESMDNLPYLGSPSPIIPQTIVTKVNFLLALADREAKFDAGEGNKGRGASVIRLDTIVQQPQ